MNEIKQFLAGFIFRWVMKIAGGYLLSVGISEGSILEIVTAVVTILIGLVISLFQHKKAIEQLPPSK